MLTRVAQIVTAAHRDLQSCGGRPTNEPCPHTKNQVVLTYFTGKNRPPTKEIVNGHVEATAASLSMGCLLF